MKNSKFNPLFESIYSRFREGAGFLAGDVVKLKSGYESMDCYKSLAENVKQRIQDIVKTKNNIRVGRLHNKHSGYGALGGPIHPACHADIYEEVAPSFWRNLVTVPVEMLEEINTGVNLPPVPDSQKDTRDRVTGPTEVAKDKSYKSDETDEQTKLAEKQTHAKKGDYELPTKNTELAHSNSYNDAKPSKVKGMEKAKEIKESVEDVYGKMLLEDVGAMGAGANAEEAYASGQFTPAETQPSETQPRETRPNRPLIINGKEVEDIEFQHGEPGDYSDFGVISARFVDGTELTPQQVDELEKTYPNELLDKANRDGDFGMGHHLDENQDKHMSMEEFVKKYMAHIEDQEEKLVRDDPSLSGKELQTKAAHMVAGKMGINLG